MFAGRRDRKEKKNKEDRKESSDRRSLASPRDRDSVAATAPAAKPVEPAPAAAAPAASHFADEEPAAKTLPASTSSSKEQYFEKEEPKPKTKTEQYLEDPKPQPKKKSGRTKKTKKVEVHVDDAGPMIKAPEEVVDETDRKKATNDIRDLQLLEPTDSSLTWEQSFANSLTDDVYAGYSKLLGFARQLNAGIVPFAEFVLVGFSGAGKSSLLEVLLGQPVNVVGVGATKRPIFFQWVNNRSAQSLKVTVKRDPSHPDFDKDVEVALASLEMEINRRMSAESETPIFVTFERHDTLNFTVIDTPGLGQSGATDALVRELATPPQRHILAVQRAVPEPNNELLAALGDIDPDLTRTTLVYAGLFDMLKVVQDAETLGRFFSRTPDNGHKFFSSLPFLAERPSLQSRTEYCEIVFKMHHRDLQTLEQLQYDTALASSMGALSLRSWMLDFVWRSFQKFIPSLLQTARERVTQSQADLSTVREQMDSFKGPKLRSLASGYATEFLQAVASLLEGTAEGNAVVNGESLGEEKKGHGDAVWRASNNLPINFKKEPKVPLADTKLYGGQQLERLLAEFQAVAHMSDIASPTMAAVANAAGLNKLSNSTDVSWASSELAQATSRDAFVPLIRNLASRAAYIMKRAGEIARRMMDNRRRAEHVFGASQLQDVDDATRYVSFRHFVGNAYDAFIEQQTQVLVQKCLDEFYSTRTVHYALAEASAAHVGQVDTSDPEELRKGVIAMAQHTFEQLRTRIIRNVVLKVYNFLLVPMQSVLWSSLQAQISSLSDAELQSKFEVAATLQSLQKTERDILENIESGKTVQVDVQRAAQSFSPN